MFNLKASIPSSGSWKLPITFTSHLNEEFKSCVYLKNSTGRENLAMEIRAIPKTNPCLPRTINFGNVDIGLRLVAK